MHKAGILPVHCQPPPSIGQLEHQGRTGASEQCLRQPAQSRRTGTDLNAPAAVGSAPQSQLPGIQGGKAASLRNHTAAVLPESQPGWHRQRPSDLLLLLPGQRQSPFAVKSQTVLGSGVRIQQQVTVAHHRCRLQLGQGTILQPQTAAPCQCDPRTQGMQQHPAVRILCTAHSRISAGSKSLPQPQHAQSRLLSAQAAAVQLQGHRQTASHILCRIRPGRHPLIGVHLHALPQDGRLPKPGILPQCTAGFHTAALHQHGAGADPRLPAHHIVPDVCTVPHHAVRQLHAAANGHLPAQDTAPDPTVPSDFQSGTGAAGLLQPVVRLSVRGNAL